MPNLFSGLPTPSWDQPSWLQPSPLLGIVSQAAGNFRRAKEAEIQTQGQLLQLERDRQLMDAGVQAQKGQAEFAGRLAEIGSNGTWNDPESKKAVWDVASRYPAIMNTPIFKDTMDNFQKSDAAQKRVDVLEDQIKQREGADAAKQTEADARLQFWKDKAQAGTKASQVVDEIQEAEKARDALPGGANNPDYEKANERVELLMQQLPAHNNGLEIQGLNPDGTPSFKVTQGGPAFGKIGKTGTQVATASLAQKNVMEYENATKLISGLQSSLRSMDIGAAGVAGDLADKGLSQIPGMEGQVFSQKRVENRANLRAARISLMRKMADDTMRFTAKDVEDVGNLLPSSGFFESLPDAKAKLSAVRQIITDRVKTYSEATGAPNPLWNRPAPEIRNWLNQTKANIQKAVQANRMTAAQGEAAAADALNQASEAIKIQGLPQQ